MWLLSPTKDTTLVENFDLIENSAVTDFSTKVVSLGPGHIWCLRRLPRSKLPLTEFRLVWPGY